MKSTPITGLTIDENEGVYILSALKDNSLITRKYLGYSLRTAKKLFSTYYANY